MAISKLPLIGGTIGLASATAGGVAIYLNNSKETVISESIKEHISKQKGSNFKFISLVSQAHESLKNRYEAAGASHKPTENGSVVTKDQIIAWCERVENTKFSSETDPTYLSINTWCFVNDNTLLQQAGKSNEQNIVGSDGSAQGWKDAWTAYKSKKSSEQLEITGNDIGALNTASDSNAGGPALYNWCNTNGSKKMYEVGAEENFKKYSRWCFKS